MSDSGGSPTSSPPAPPADSAPPPETSPPPPADSSPPPPSDPQPSPPPPDSLLPPLPSLLPPLTATPPPASNPPPADSNNSPPPPTSTNTPSPPANSDTPPAPPNESNNPPPSPDVQSPPPPPPSSSSTNPETPPPESPPAPPSEPTHSPPAPPSDPTNSPPIQPSPPAYSPPPSSLLAPHKPNGGSGRPVVPPSVPSRETPSTNSGNGNQTMVGMAVAGVAIMALIAIVFLVRRKKKRNIDAYAHSQYLPHPNFSVKSDGFSYGQDASKIYSGPGGSMYNSQQQQQYSSMGNSYGSQRGQSNDSAILGTGQTHFSYEELAEITQGFARHNILGEGGFGCVYKGTLHDGKVVAVKQLKAGSGQGDREFKAEVEIISRVHHRHLVSLVGYCISDQHRLLIYEYVSNQTLEHHLHGRGRPVLEWSKRVRIAIGSAKGLAYLHEDCHPKIIHRDIKSANILLDDEYEAQVADFGLARLNDTTQTHVSTRVMGTFGYLAPEYASSGKLTDRSDVFSFGVVLLELVTGRKPVDQNQPLGEESLVEWARPLLLKAIETGDFSELIDRRLEKHYVEHEVFRMIETAAACVRHSGPKRPRMVQVVRALDCDEESGDISNGIKVGQSTTYNSGQYNQDITKFRKMAFGSGDSGEAGMYSGDHSVISSSDFSGNESETRPFNNRRF
ncbi:unnamed protein product [Brassica oleracea]|uniref:non-specific serine/threonine protein kinase n=1 Tax=Brassica oleracea var. oleracea TaxID=109376 RepID=A0A0D3DR25_BRAOL|nr:PREDICTED: proline-rich receptor-like protein kinase PERK12 [Brassica oleracea var. oleracea]